MQAFIDSDRLAALQRRMSGETPPAATPATETDAVREAPTDPAPVELAPAITESVSITPMPSQSRTHLMTDHESWGWAEIRDYVVTEIEARTGPFPRDARKEASIFKRWVSKYGSDAPAIAKYAFEVCDGRWRGAPISINRFCKGSDFWYSDVILDHLRESESI